MFDLGVRQIAQETIPEHCRGKVNGQWKSMTSAFEMVSFVIAFFISGSPFTNFSNISHIFFFERSELFLDFSFIIYFHGWFSPNYIYSDSTR